MNNKIFYSKEFKENILAKVLAANAPSIVELAKEHNVLPNAASRWVHRMRVVTQLRSRFMIRFLYKEAHYMNEEVIFPKKITCLMFSCKLPLLSLK